MIVGILLTPTVLIDPLFTQCLASPSVVLGTSEDREVETRAHLASLFNQELIGFIDTPKPSKNGHDFC